MDLRELYQDIILDHGRHPRNFRCIAEPSNIAKGHNPLCGDKVRVFVILQDGRISDVALQGSGCAISTASASLMTEVIKGKTLPEADSLYRAFHARVTGGAEPQIPAALEDDADRLLPLGGVKAYPARVKCATLAWHTLDAALHGAAADAAVKTE
ncbi:MAG TPA: SUF system NifU family Fe-S cluster assembly protein [Acidisphaera sp.]|nr:SUF system NifU family Fe-S cluster assembly protein [Acidisphaera sp.]